MQIPKSSMTTNRMPFDTFVFVLYDFVIISFPSPVYM